MVRLLLTVVFTAAVAFCQLGAANPGISIYVTRSVNLPPEKSYVAVTVGMDADSTVDRAVQIVSSLGITAADLLSLSTEPGDESQIFYGFALTVPFSKQKDTLASLAAIQKRLTDQNSSSTLHFSLQGIAGNDHYADDNRAELTAALLADARRKAQTMAQAGGFTIGRVLSISDISMYLGGGGPYYPSGLNANFGLSVVFALQ